MHGRILVNPEKDKSVSSTTVEVFDPLQTAQLNHPDMDGRLLKVIQEIAKTDDFKTIEEFQEKVYAKMKRQAFSFKYILRDIYADKNKEHYELSTSRKLLFWLCTQNGKDADELKQNLVAKLVGEIAKKDDRKNNILHIAAFYGDMATLNAVRDEYYQGRMPQETYYQLINARNSDGTTPLGMAFLNQNNSKGATQIHNVVRYFTGSRGFKVNDYLNNKKGIDFESKPYLLSIGGFNCLHMALALLDSGMLSILLGSARAINCECPTMNPLYHMNNPKVFLENYHSGVIGRVVWSLSLNDYTYRRFHKFAEMKNLLSQIIDNIRDVDSSGDSDNENNPAYQYKQELMSFAKIIAETQAAQPLAAEVLAKLNAECLGAHVDKLPDELLDQIMLPHFHGVPFMQGHYSHQERRDVASNFFQINHDKTEPTLTLHSRTTTSTMGVKNLYELQQKNSPEEVDEIARYQRLISDYLSSCSFKDEMKFNEAVEIYVNDFSSNPINQFWNKLAQIQTPPPEIVKYRFPILSVSKAIDHPLRFAIGNNVETQSLGERQITPQYNHYTKPKHRLAGLLFITMHSLREMLELEKQHKIVDVHRLQTQRKISTNLRGGASQHELGFLDSIDPEHIVAAVPIVYPNLSKNFNAEYHGTVFGLKNKGKKNEILNYQNARSILNLNETNMIADNGFTQFGRLLKKSYLPLIGKLAKAIADQKGKQLCYLQGDGRLVEFSADYVGEFSSPQKEMTQVVREKSSPIRSPTYKQISEDTEKNDGGSDEHVVKRTLFHK